MENQKSRVVLCIKPVKTELLFQNNNGDNEPFQMNPYELKALEKQLADLRDYAACSQCGYRVQRGLAFCPKCGEKLPNENK